MTQPSQFDPLGTPPRRVVRSRWRQSAGLIVQLVVLALVAILLGLFIFPL